MSNSVNRLHYLFANYLIDDRVNSQEASALIGIAQRAGGVTRREEEALRTLFNQYESAFDEEAHALMSEFLNVQLRAATFDGVERVRMSFNMNGGDNFLIETSDRMDVATLVGAQVSVDTFVTGFIDGNPIELRLEAGKTSAEVIKAIRGALPEGYSLRRAGRSFSVVTNEPNNPAEEAPLASGSTRGDQGLEVRALGPNRFHILGDPSARGRLVLTSEAFPAIVVSFEANDTLENLMQKIQREIEDLTGPGNQRYEAVYSAVRGGESFIVAIRPASSASVGE